LLGVETDGVRLRAAVEVLANGLKVRDALAIEDLLAVLERAVGGRQNAVQGAPSSSK
jgi:hypothetical protein